MGGVGEVGMGEDREPGEGGGGVGREGVGYSMLLDVIVRRLAGAPPPHRLLLCVLGLMLEVRCRPPLPLPMPPALAFLLLNLLP